MLLNKGGYSFSSRQRQVVFVNRISGMVNFACAVFGESLADVIGRRPKKERLCFPHLSRFAQHFECGRSYLIVADLRVYPNYRHLNHLAFSEKVSQLLAAFPFVGHDFAGLPLRRPAYR